MYQLSNEYVIIVLFLLTYFPQKVIIPSVSIFYIKL